MGSDVNGADRRSARGSAARAVLTSPAPLTPHVISLDREKGKSPDHLCLGIERRLFSAGGVPERGQDDKGSPPVLDQPGAMAMAGLHHSGRHLTLPRPSHRHHLLLLSHCLYHLAEGSLHGTGTQIPDQDQQCQDDYVPAQQFWWR